MNPNVLRITNINTIHINMDSKKNSMFKQIALITNDSGNGVTKTLKDVVTFLRGKDIDIVIDEYCDHYLPDTGLKVFTTETFPVECDLAIAISACRAWRDGLSCSHCKRASCGRGATPRRVNSGCLP